jgi:hypothetical protein
MSDIATMLLEALEESRDDHRLVGDESAATMLGDIIEGYRGGWVSESHARVALFASERRLGNTGRLT